MRSHKEVHSANIVKHSFLCLRLIADTGRAFAVHNLEMLTIPPASALRYLPWSPYALI